MFNILKKYSVYFLLVFSLIQWENNQDGPCSENREANCVMAFLSATAGISSQTDSPIPASDGGSDNDPTVDSGDDPDQSPEDDTDDSSNEEPVDESEEQTKDWEYEEGEELSGGEKMTSSDFTEAAFARFGDDFPLAKISDFTVGQSIFEIPWIEAEASGIEDRKGLGPLFNQTSCIGCHIKNGRGRSPESESEAMESALIRLSSGSDGSSPDPSYGNQFQPFGISTVAGEGNVKITYEEVEGKFADGTEYTLRKPVNTFEALNYGPLAADLKTSLRISPPVIGLGLLEAISEESILANADPSDLNGDGISGRANSVIDKKTGTEKLGRFGWKANEPGLEQQNSGAFLGDMGLTTPMNPNNNCSDIQLDCLASPFHASPEVEQNRVSKVTEYTRLIAVPGRRNADESQVLRGKKIFFQTGCVKCHVAKFVTSSIDTHPELSEQTVRPYTDLLLHDMGEGLADNRPDFLATGREWRTAPLWGIGLIETVNGHNRFLHDGRARGLMEAILWHGGEAESSRNTVLALPETDRADLLRFLESL